MKNKYRHLIEQSFEFPNEEFSLIENELQWFDIPLMDVIKQYGTPLRIFYLPKITQNIQRAKKMFNVAMAKADYEGDYHYCYCTKSSHFSFILEEVLKQNIHIETIYREHPITYKKWLREYHFHTRQQIRTGLIERES